jgi:hypothetical protein
MSRRVPAPVVDELFDGDATILDVVDHVLNKGVLATGDLTMGVAGVDLIYLRVSALLCAADRVLPRPPVPRRPAKRRGGAKRPSPSRR